MLKRIIAAVLAFSMIFVLASCKGKKDPAATKPTSELIASVTSEALNIPDKKIAILVAAEEQYPEDYRAAKQIEAAFPDKVTVREYPATVPLVAGDPEIMTISREIAADDSYGAIIYAKATQYTYDAVRAAKEVNPEIKTVCVEPEGSVDKLANSSELVICVDWVKAANDIVAQAKAQGAQYFIFFSHNRHISGNGAADDGIAMLYATAKNAVSVACEEQGITFISDTAPDPIHSGGINAVNRYMREAIGRHAESYPLAEGNVALFSSDAFAQQELINIANEKGYIYISPSFPSAYNGISSVYDVAIPENIIDVDTYIESAKAAVDGNAKFSIYSYPLATVMLYTAVYCTFDLLSGNTTAENLSDKVTMRATDCAANDGFTVETFGNYTNVFAVYCPAFEAL